MSHPKMLTKSGLSFFTSFFFFQKNTYCCRTRRLSVRLSVRSSARLSSVKIFFCGISVSNKPIDLKIGLNVCKRVVDVRKG